MTTRATLFHIVEQRDWGDDYRPASLDRQGFVHLSTREQLPATLELHFDSDAVLLLIELDRARLGTALRWDVVPGRAEAMPHLYGEIEFDAIIATHRMTRGEGGWQLPRE